MLSIGKIKWRYVNNEGGVIIDFCNCRELFAKLTAEELEAGWSDEHDEDIPNFGDSGSSYEDVSN